jgi:hypothetical protein
MTVPVLLVRLRSGVVGESLRVVHVVPFDEDHVTEAGFTAYCGLEIKPGTAEQLQGYDGMPCEPCVLVAPTPPAALEGGGE